MEIPGSKSITNRALILAALAEAPTTIHGALRSRDTDLMMAALTAMGTEIQQQSGNAGGSATSLHIKPHPLHGAQVDCGLAGTVMRFIPPVAVLANGTVFLDGDPAARQRPLDTVLDALRALGVDATGSSLPCQIRGNRGDVSRSRVDIDASRSSQFVSGLLLAGARYPDGLTVVHTGDLLPSQPHIDMTIDMLRESGVQVDTSIPRQWTVYPGPIHGRTWVIEPDLSNATPFLAAAALTGGCISIPLWPQRTDQPGDQFRDVLERMGANCELIQCGPSHRLQVTGSADGLAGISIDMHDIGELTPTVAALAALAHSPSQISGVTHLRGHETDRLKALVTEINRLGGRARETADGLIIEPAPLHGGLWHSYDDHRMATAGAIIGLLVDDVEVENIATTAKTFPGFELKWQGFISPDSAKLTTIEEEEL